jgi:diadenosine tetraphosphate (Ap4A) HIT family hydrolase
VTALALIPETIVHEGPRWTIAVNRNQNLLGKTMLVLNRPCTSIVEVTSEEWMVLHDLLQVLVHTLTALFTADHFNFAFLMNQDAHVHLHVIPRYATRREWNGHRFDDSHWGTAFGHEQRQLPARDLEGLATEIRDALFGTTSVS